MSNTRIAKAIDRIPAIERNIQQVQAVLSAATPEERVQNAKLRALTGDLVQMLVRYNDAKPKLQQAAEDARRRNSEIQTARWLGWEVTLSLVAILGAASALGVAAVLTDTDRIAAQLAKRAMSILVEIDPVRAAALTAEIATQQSTAIALDAQRSSLFDTKGIGKAIVTGAVLWFGAQLISRPKR